MDQLTSSSSESLSSELLDFFTGLGTGTDLALETVLTAVFYNNKIQLLCHTMVSSCKLQLRIKDQQSCNDFLNVCMTPWLIQELQNKKQT